MSKNNKSKRDVILGILLISVISLCIFNFLEMRDLIGLKVNLDKGIQLNGMHWECEREYNTTKKIGCEGRCDADKCDLSKVCDISPESCGIGKWFWTWDIVNYKIWNYLDTNDVVHCFELKDCGCEITWKYEKACTRDILVRDK
jgi:hypothetical protein